MYFIVQVTLATLFLLLTTSSLAAVSYEPRLIPCQAQSLLNPKHLCPDEGVLTGTMSYWPKPRYALGETGDRAMQPYHCLTDGDRLMLEFELKLRLEGKFPQ